MQSLAGSELLEAEVFQLKYSIDFAHVVVACSFELFLPRRNVNEQERSVREHKFLLIVGDITTLDPVFIEQEIRDLHQRPMHPVLDVQEVERMACLDQS